MYSKIISIFLQFPELYFRQNGHGQYHPEEFADEPAEDTMLGEGGHGQYHPEQFYDPAEDQMLGENGHGQYHPE